MVMLSLICQYVFTAVCAVFDIVKLVAGLVSLNDELVELPKDIPASLA